MLASQMQKLHLSPTSLHFLATGGSQKEFLIMEELLTQATVAVALLSFSYVAGSLALYTHLILSS